MEGVDPIKKKYKPLDEQLSTPGRFPYSEAKFIIIPSVIDDSGRYKVAKHVGKEGAKDEKEVATHLVIYNLKTNEQTSISLKNTKITESEQPGKDLCYFIAKQYRYVILVTAEGELKIIEEESDLENTITNIITEENRDVEEVIENYKKASKSKEVKKYEGKEEEVEAKKEVEGEVAEEEAGEDGGKGDGEGGDSGGE